MVGKSCKRVPLHPGRKTRYLTLSSVIFLISVRGTYPIIGSVGQSSLSSHFFLRSAHLIFLSELWTCYRPTKGHVVGSVRRTYRNLMQHIPPRLLNEQFQISE